MLFRLKEMEFVEKIAENISDISLGGNGQILKQMKAIFTPSKYYKVTLKLECLILI